MNLASIFIRRPVMTTLLMLSILIFGLMGYQRLPVSDLPNVDYPTIMVTARLPGANSETMAAAVATPLEKQFSTIAGISSMNSNSAQGSSSITLQFDLDRDIDAAAQDVQAAIARTMPRLPKDMPFPPTYRKVNPADQAILMVVLTSPTLPLYRLNEYGENILAQRISMVSGVAQVEIHGSQKYAVRIQVDPRALKAREMTIDDVSRAVRSANSNLPTGTIEGPQRIFSVETTGQLHEASAYRPIIIAYRNGHPVRLQDVASALDSVEAEKNAAWFGDERAIILAVQRQPGTNTVAVAEAVKKLLPTFKEQIPASVSLQILYDRSESIKESVRDVKFTMVFALVLVVLVIFLFLRRLSPTLIPSVAMPMSIIGTFAVMYLLGYSLNNLSLMALILCVGFVVDDAIVMLENIVRHIEKGEEVLQAAYNGSREIAFTIISMTISLAAVFIPVLFMGGIIGRLFREFAVTIGVAVLISGFISLTLTPMLCSRFLRSSHRERKRGLYRVSEMAFQGMLTLYSAGLRWFLRHRLITMVFTALILVGTVTLFQRLPKGFIPSEDTGQIMVSTEGEQGISYEAMLAYQQTVKEVVKADPNVEKFMSSVGRGFMGRGTSGSMFIRLKPRHERVLNADGVVNQLRPKLAQIPGIRVYVQNPPVLRVGGMYSRSMYQYTLQSPDTEELFRYAPLLEERMRSLPGLMDVNSDLQLKNPNVTLQIDRDKASMLGLSAEQIESALYSAYGAREVTTIYAANNDYAVIMEIKPEYQRDPSALSQLYVRSSTAQLIPLDAVAKVITGVGPASIGHLGQLPAVTISFNLRPGIALGDSVNTVGEMARTTLPPTISTSFQGTAQVFQSSFSGMLLLLIMSIVVIYIVLGVLYESFFHPVTILSALPFAGFGALVTLMIFHTELNIYAYVGIVMLIGLVKKNGIMMVDFAIEAQKTPGTSPIEAVYQACLVRFRPIMMTTMAALMGTLPIALGYGAGGESRQPLGLAVVGGLLFSQFLTLFVTPVFYTYMEGLHALLTRAKKKTMIPYDERVEPSLIGNSP